MKKFLLLIIFIILLVLFYGWQGIYLPRNPNSEESKLFLVEKGKGVKEISSALQEQGFIKDRNLFNLYIFWKQAGNKLQAGEYLLSFSMAVPEIMDKLVSGEITEKKITIIEGWSKNEIAQYLENEQMFSAEDFLEIVADRSSEFSQKYNFLKSIPKGLDLEGYLFPDTYQVDKSIDPEDMVEVMLENFDSKLSPELKMEIEKQEKSVFEIVTIASLLEKEVRTIEDKKIVSGILRERMRLGIPLQIDATIAYITGKKTTKISKEETQVDSPYNTYKYRGLPLGPICNSGFESILASVYYEDSDYLYYLSTPEGETIFSRTLKEHNIAKVKYLK